VCKQTTAQGVISLDVKGTEPRPFRIKLFASGLRVGKLTGSVAIAESPTVRTSPPQLTPHFLLTPPLYVCVCVL
jgi:hypothetical protein